MIDFRLLYDHPISKPCSFWEQCDSHCCTIGRLLQPHDPATHLVALPIPAVEFDYLRSLGAPGDQWPEPARKFEIGLSGYELTVYMQPCLLGGACNSDWRPSICRIYPYFPLIDDDFRIVSLMKATALDLIWDKRDDDPCLMRGPEEGPRHVALMEDLVGKLKRDRGNHELLLWLNLAYRYIEAFKAYFEDNLPEGKELSLDELVENLYFCNSTQLFLADPGFRARMDGEVERYRRWGAA